MAANALIEGNLDRQKVQGIYKKNLKMNVLRQLKIARTLSWILYYQPGISNIAFNKIGQELCE